jgi:hypothetical protein
MCGVLKKCAEESTLAGGLMHRSKKASLFDHLVAERE